MKMFLAGLLTGGMIGGALSVAMLCLVTAGKWADEEMEHVAALKAGKPPEETIEEGQVDECGNETM